MVKILGKGVEKAEKNKPLPEALEKIVGFMKGDATISVTFMSKWTGLSPGEVKAHIQTLKTMDLIERVGIGRGGYWLVKPPK
ncbi:MAG: hypothetical protein LBF38_04740 [Deltaproteobacteria bacterium]|jgi:DNA-binding IscR family transcriptional regulator|nr:hypothetical protein [Deltaproteobacteria bacterium]